MNKAEIAIVGAGMSGLVAACTLQRMGFRPRVYEKSAALGEVGAGLTLAPNATHALQFAGLTDALAMHGMSPGRAGVRHWRTGKLMISLERGDQLLEQFGARYYQIHRADLHAALAAKVLANDSAAIHLDCEFTAMRQDGSRVEAQFANGERVTADVLIGADGVRSGVRAALFGQDQPRFTGYIAFRGLVPCDALPTGIIEPPSCLSTGPDRSFTRYLIRGGRVVNYVALAQRDGWQEEGWSIPATVDEVLREYHGWYDDVATIVRATPVGSLFKWAVCDRATLPAWTQGRVTLMGDAAHAMLPFLGSGAAIAIEDAVILARCLECSESIDAALQRYFLARHERTAWVAQKSREAARNYHSGRSEHYQRDKHITAESLGIWAYNPATVSI
ncbi:MAG: FAD-dependent monooxygenase [Pseudomonadales bacterium]|jgi:salicylate hydroxylase|nr:FAD-dependent monooxygenase [Pseudomonadales bacterium]